MVAEEIIEDSIDHSMEEVTDLSKEDAENEEEVTEL